MATPQVFDIVDPRALFDVLDRRFAAYCLAGEKSTEDLLFVALEANHLRQ